ncbi:hypothetical protein, partial [Streptomyces niphimycinicus]|uniref:hypothetical protein n=1 Tax=Streptomyces niphimycinicus TaxID=2842201 RepID=UPI001C0CDA5B
MTGSWTGATPNEGDRHLRFGPFHPRRAGRHPPGHDRVEDIAVAPRPGRAEPMALIASAAPLSSADAVAHLRSEAIS